MQTLSLSQSAKAVSRKRFLAGSLTLFLLPGFVYPQAANGKPITRSGLTQALTIGGLSQKGLENQVTRRGVDFNLSADAEADLRRAGASGDLIKAVRENYRGTPNADSALSAPDAPDAGSSATRNAPSASSGPARISNDSSSEGKHPLSLHDVRKL